MFKLKLLLLHSSHFGRVSSTGQRVRGTLWGLFLGTLSLLVYGQPDAPESESRFRRTVVALQDDATDRPVAFARIALMRLAEAYAGEARLAREQGQGLHRDARLRGWSSAVEGYARQLTYLLEDIEQGFPVRLIGGEGSSPAVEVAARSIILSHPRPSQQGAFELEILQEFCARYGCRFTEAEESEVALTPAYTRLVTPAWSFTRDGTFCTYRGITILFTNERHVANSRSICDRVMQEAALLADELAWQQRHAVAIDWSRLSVAVALGGPEHMVRLNTAGDVLLVSIPLLHGTPKLLSALIPWLQGQINEGAEVDVELEAANYRWHDS
ncbi:MAG: hypothetical protein HRT77_14770 [Halioglobus sp.]|nr:hypothetical protein [Halioglobus sp.]